MAKFIVNKGPNKEVHRKIHTTTGCNIHQIAPHNRIDTDEDYTDLYPGQYDGCKHCYAEKHRK